MLVLKKLFARLFFPVPVIFLLLAVGLVLLFWPKPGKYGHRAGKILVCTATLLLLLASIFGSRLLLTLTGRYAPIDPDKLPKDNYTLVVPGSGFYRDPSLPPEHRFNDGMLLRLQEAGRIAQALSKRGMDCRIFASIVGSSPTAEKRRALETLLGHYGIPPSRISFCENALTSRREVAAFSKLPGKKILVSESFHMPRLMMLSKRYKLAAIPAPASRGTRNGGIFYFVPSGERIADCERAVYEYLGMLQYLLF